MVRFEPPRTPRTQRSGEPFIKPTISRIGTYSWDWDLILASWRFKEDGINQPTFFHLGGPGIAHYLS
jgi:hypothetical protein